ncbi:cell surface protein [Haloarcula sp. CBA1130]|uniref:cell surface protein n=1 Tax=unclassified Haloarcula TaxID=2624677 RepID=UPI001247DF56|nr:MULTISPECIES: cell surface protein [unclassified Haloarcula]KAA9397292.1 cell surface protein [Haloarcula sp. CBA1129]KAA9402672.1 cell surface protein [Haloarcula sp. CBA1130]
MTDDTTCSVRGRVRTASRPLALVALVLLTGTAPALAAGQTTPTISIDTGSIAAGETTTVPVVLTSAPDGLAGYQLELSVDDPSVARFEGASYPSRLGLTTDPVIASDGGTVTLEAADLDGQVEPGATDVTLATVALTGVDGGEARVTVASSQVDADGGGAVEPTTEPAVLAVSPSEPTEAGAAVTEAPSPASEATAEPAGTTEGDAAGDGDQSTTGADGSLPIALTVAALAALAAVAALAASTSRQP